jgi:hypothetical protein
MIVGPVLLSATLATALQLTQTLPGVPSLDDAERQLERAVAELEEIVGSELLEVEPPRIPALVPVDLTGEEASLLQRLREVEPFQWSEADRQSVEIALSRNGAPLAGLTSGREDADLDPLLVLPLLGAARLRSGQDRLSLARGDATAFFEGLEARGRIASRLRLHPTIMAAIVATDLQRDVVADLQLAVEASSTEDVLLAALDWELAGWERQPDAAAALAREALYNLRQSEELKRTRPRDLAGEGSDPYSAQTMAPWLSDLAFLARRCREVGCERAIDEVTERAKGDDNPYQSVSEIMLPNLFAALRKIEEVELQRELARTAIALRLHALEYGDYPGDLAELPATLAAGRGELAGVLYRRDSAGARLEREATEPAWEGKPPASVALSRRLRVWQLPPIARPSAAVERQVEEPGGR